MNLLANSWVFHPALPSTLHPIEASPKLSILLGCLYTVGESITLYNVHRLNIQGLYQFTTLLMWLTSTICYNNLLSQKRLSEKEKEFRDDLSYSGTSKKQVEMPLPILSPIIQHSFSLLALSFIEKKQTNKQTKNFCTMHV